MNRLPPRVNSAIRWTSLRSSPFARYGHVNSMGGVFNGKGGKKTQCAECKTETSGAPVCRNCLAKQRFTLKPSDVYSGLSDVVIGQEHVKRVLSVAAVSHLHRVRANQRLKQLALIEEAAKRARDAATKAVNNSNGSASSSPASPNDAVDAASLDMLTGSPGGSLDRKPVQYQERDSVSRPGNSGNASPGSPAGRKVFAVKVDPSTGSFAVRPQPPVEMSPELEQQQPEEPPPGSTELDQRLLRTKEFNVRKLDKGNILLLGPTGTGKTLLAKTLADIIQGPLAICDATSLTAAGYVGDDVESILYKLLDSVQWDVSQAEQGIVYLDEIDKIAKRVSTRHAKDVGGESVQHGLLKMLEGSKITVTKKSSATMALSVTIDTSNILFICAGAFTGIDAIVAKRKTTRSLGFGNDVSATYDEVKGSVSAEMHSHKDKLYQSVEPADMVEFGMIPEFVGRFGAVVSTSVLSETDLIRILTEPQNAIVNQMKSLFMIAFPHPVHLIFTKEALRGIARTAQKEGTGARGLKIVVERLLSDCQFEIPDRPWVTHVIVDENTVLGKSKCLEMTQHDFDIWVESHPEYKEQVAAASPPTASTPQPNEDEQQRIRGVA